MARFNDYTLSQTLGDFDSNSFGEGNGNGTRNFLQDEIDDGGGGGRGNTGGGGGTGGGTRTQSSNLFIISCNVNGAAILINGVNTGKTTDNQIAISKTDLIGGDKTITLSKTGYTTNESYVVSLSTNDTILIKSDFIDEGFGGLGTTEIICKYYINGVVVNSLTDYSVGNLKTLMFKLNAGDGDDFVDEEFQQTLRINLVGNAGGNPILLEKNKTFKGGSQMFPAMGTTTYRDTIGTKYTISSADIKLYRIVEIDYKKGNTNQRQNPLVATEGESLTMEFTLSDIFKMTIRVEKVESIIPLISPKIELLDNANRLYNINTAIGVPLAFKKNSAVEAITIIVGDDILEFDDLEKGDVAGVVIPHSVFNNIGKYNIEIFPFSLNDYGQTDTIDELPIDTTPIKPIFDIIEEIISPPKETIIEESFNQYTQNNINTNYLSNNIGSNGYNFQFTGLDNFLGINVNSSILNNYR